MSAEGRRLQRILEDENYGPKLARLGRADERRVLSLVEQNKGREARQLINELDEQRRYLRRTHDAADVYIRFTPNERKDHWQETMNDIKQRDLDMAEFWKRYKRLR